VTGEVGYNSIYDQGENIITVCDTCDYNNLDDAVNDVSRYINQHESDLEDLGTQYSWLSDAGRPVEIRIKRNSDGSPFTITKRLQIVGGDYGKVKITSGLDTVYYSPPASASSINSMFKGKRTVPPKFDSLTIIRNSNLTLREWGFSCEDCDGFIATEINIEGFDRQTDLTRTSGVLYNWDIGNPIPSGNNPANHSGTAGIQILSGSVIELRNIEITADSIGRGYGIEENCVVHISGCNARNYVRNGLIAVIVTW